MSEAGNAAVDHRVGTRVERWVVAFLTAVLGAFLCFLAVFALGIFTGILGVCGGASALVMKVYMASFAVVPIAGAIALPCATLGRWYPKPTR